MKDLKRFPQPKIKKLGGVCAGLAYAKGWNPTLMRLVAFLLFLAPIGLGKPLGLNLDWISVGVLLVYYAAWFVMPCWDQVPEDRQA